MTDRMQGTDGYRWGKGPPPRLLGGESHGGGGVEWCPAPAAFSGGNEARQAGHSLVGMVDVFCGKHARVTGCLSRWGRPECYGKLVTLDGVVLVGVAAPISLTTCSITPVSPRDTVRRSCNWTPATFGASKAWSATTAGLTLKKQ
jgi:hypothetical protein